MSNNPESSMLKDLIKGALTTAISIIVTYYVTASIESDKNKQNNVEKEKQRMEALEKTNVLLSSYISRYDSLHNKYLALLDSQHGEHALRTENTSFNTEPNTPTDVSKVSAVLVNGNWVTPDGTIQWDFNNKVVVVGGIGSYAGFIEGKGTYEISGSQVTGTIHVTKAFYLPINETLKFSCTISSDNRSMYGTNTDGSGNVNAMTLYKN